MNNNTKAKFKRTTRKSRSVERSGARARNVWNKKGKVAANGKKNSFAQ